MPRRSASRSSTWASTTSSTSRRGWRGRERGARAPPPPPGGGGAAPADLPPRRSVLTLCGFLFAALAALYFLLPKLAGLHDTWRRIENGSPWWMALALAFTV